MTDGVRDSVRLAAAKGNERDVYKAISVLLFLGFPPTAFFPTPWYIVFNAMRRITVSYQH